MMKPNADQPKAPDRSRIEARAKPGSKPDAKDDLKTLPMAEVEKKLGSSPDGLTACRGEEATDPIWT